MYWEGGRVLWQPRLAEAGLGYYIGRLSEDALPEVKTAVGVTDGDTKQQLVDSLGMRSVPSDWQSWNLARSQTGH